MPNIRIEKRIPNGEMLKVFVDGDYVEGDEFFCEENFCLVVNQHVESREPETVKRNFLELVATFIFGGRKIAGDEVVPPWQAVWEGDCRADKDGKLTISLQKENGHPSIDVISDEMEIVETRSDEIIRETDKKVWFGNLLVYLVPFLLFFVFLTFMVLSTLDAESWFFSIPFMLFAWFMGGSVIYGLVRQAHAPNAREVREVRIRKTNNRIHRAIQLLKFSVGVSIVGAVLQIFFGLTGLKDQVPLVGITAIPVALTFIICSTVSNNIFSVEDVKHLREVSEYPEAKALEMWNRNAWIFGIIGILSAAFIANTV